MPTDMGEGWHIQSSSGAPLPRIGIYWQIGILQRILDTALPVGSSWSDECRRGPHGGFKTTATVISYDERVEVPAGTFPNCLLVETVTAEDRLPENMPEEERQRVVSELSGTRKMWFAPGVGLVKLLVQTRRAEIAIELTDYSLEKASSDYWPLAVGNSWSYGLANAPQDYIAKEVYEVAANEGERWFLTEYEYLEVRS